MKKLAFILALVMVFTLAFAACGSDEESSVAGGDASNTESVADQSADTSAETSGETSDEASDEESTEASDEESTEASDEESTDTSDEESTETSEEDVSIPEELNNIAAGKSYTTSELYRQGGADVNWAYDPSAEIAYPDTDNCELTDGVLPEIVTEAGEHYRDEAWIGLHFGVPEYSTLGYAYVTLDLEEATTFYGANVYVGTNLVGGGVGLPSGVSVYVSDDGESWTLYGEAVPSDASTNVCCVEFEGVAEAQYVQFRLTAGGWIFVSEVEVLG